MSNSISNLPTEVIALTLELLDAPTVAICKTVCKSFYLVGGCALPNKVCQYMERSQYQIPCTHGLAFTYPSQRDFQVISMPLVGLYWAKISNELFLTVFPTLALSTELNNDLKIRNQWECILNAVKNSSALQECIDSFIQRKEIQNIKNYVQWALIYPEACLSSSVLFSNCV